jgi:hypothetical protein
VYYIVENQTLYFVDRIVADNPLLYWYLIQINILDIIPYIRDVFKGVYLLLVYKPLVSDTNNILDLLIDNGKFIRRLGGLRSGRFLFEQTYRGWNGPQFASTNLELLSGGEYNYKVNSSNLSNNNGLRTKVF